MSRVLEPSSPRQPVSHLRHEAWLFTSADDFAAAVADFVHGGLRAGEPVCVALGPRQADAVRDRLGATALDVDFRDMAELGRNPSRIIPALAEFIAARRAQPIRVVGEPIWAGRSQQAISECVRHEALVNTAFAESPLWWICAYDVSALDPGVTATAWWTHPAVVRSGVRRLNPAYRSPAEVAALDEPLPAPPADAATVPLEAGALDGLRGFVRIEGRESGLSRTQVEDLVLAANEVVTNVLIHGGLSAAVLGTVSVWRENDHVVCDVSGAGCIEDVLVGRRPPGLSPEGGRGLWMVNHLCDLVELRSGQEGTVVRMHMQVGHDAQ